MPPPTKKSKDDPDYTLIYWPGLPGRGEFVRLPFEYAGIKYEEDLEVKDVLAYKNGGEMDTGPVSHFAPPMLKLADGNILSQTPAILSYIGPELGLSGKTPMERAWSEQITLTVLDLCNEVHDTHHPIAVELYYEDQKEESIKRAKNFRENRLCKFLKTFEDTIARNKEGNGVLVGQSVTIADLTLFQAIDGIKFAFPKCTKKIQDENKFPNVFALHKKIAESENIANYLKSNRRQKYGHGLFRLYPELDDQ